MIALTAPNLALTAPNLALTALNLALTAPNLALTALDLALTGLLKTNNMTRNEEAIALANKFVKDLAKCLFDYTDEFKEDLCGECGEEIVVQEESGFWCKKCKKGYRKSDPSGKNYGLL